MGIKDKKGFTESVWVPNNAIAADGKSATGLVRGIDISGLDHTTSNTSSFAVAHENDPVRCQISGVTVEQIVSALQGAIGTGANNLRVGDGTDSDITYYAQNADGDKPFIRYDKTTNKWVQSVDGVSSTDIGSNSANTGGDGITLTAGDIDVDLTDTVIFVPTSSGSSDSTKAPTLDSSGELASNFRPIGVDFVRNLTKETYRFSDFAVSSDSETNVARRTRITTTASANNLAHVFFDAVKAGTAGSVSLHDKNPEFVVYVGLVALTAQDGFIGFVDSGFSGTSIEDEAMILDHFGFSIADGVIKPSVADGSSQNLGSSISGTFTNENEFRGTFDGTTVKLYFNGTQVGGDITTNVPNSNLVAFEIGIIPDSTNAAKSIDIGSKSVIEFDSLT